MLEKARTSERGEERANLLGWLEARGVPRASLLPIALDPAQLGQVSYPIVCWLTRQLSTRAAWEKHGLVAALRADGSARVRGDRRARHRRLERGRPRRRRSTARPARGHPGGLRARACAALARGALAGGEAPHAAAALSALACLDPPSRVSRAVHDLRRAPGATAPIVALLAVNERLVKHSDARDASLEGVIAALHAIADAFH